MELTKPSGLVSQSVRPSVRPYVPPWCRHLPLRCRHHHSVGVDTSVNTKKSVGVNTSVNTNVKTNNSLSEIGVNGEIT